MIKTLMTHYIVDTIIENVLGSLPGSGHNYHVYVVLDQFYKADCVLIGRNITRTFGKHTTMEFHNISYIYDPDNVDELRSDVNSMSFIGVFSALHFEQRMEIPERDIRDIYKKYS